MLRVLRPANAKSWHLVDVTCNSIHDESNAVISIANPSSREISCKTE